MSGKYNPFTFQSEGSPTSPALMNADKEKQDTTHSDLEEHKRCLLSALRDAKSVRRSVMRQIQASPYVPGRETEFLDNTTMFTKVNTVIRHMTEHLESVNLELEKIQVKDAVGSSDYFLGHCSISDWSKEVQDQSKDLCTLVTSISGVGAAITYTTIFSATRGSIGLMSWAFVLFMMGLALPMGSQILLSWAALMPPATKFPALMLKSWRFVVSVSILCGIFGTVSAVFLLLISLYQIQYSPVASGESTTIEFTTAPRDAFWLAIACVSIGCLHLIKVHLLFIRDNTWENLGAIYLVSRRRAERSTGVEL